MPSNETKKGPTRSSEAPKNDAIGLERQPKGRERSSVYDFLYHDVRRIGSFLAQFETYGVVQNIRASESTGRITTTKTGFSASGGIPSVAQGQAARDQTATEDERDTAERTYDPLWSNARTLLDYLEAADLIGRDLATARIGQFVIASGDLTVLNTSMLPRFFESARYRELTIRSAVDGFRKQWNAVPQNAALNDSDKAMAEAAAVKVTEEAARVNMDIISHFPYSTQCTIIGGGLSVWTTLTVEGMIGSVADLSLKHGTNIPGNWHLLGILDALPSPIPPPIPTPYTGTPEHFDKVIINLSNIGRALLGRKPEAYGMTALLLFREVSARAQ